MRILLTNDDGPFGPGLVPLHRELTRLGDVRIVCPAEERSGAGHSITVLTPLRERHVTLADGADACLLTGTPADCVKFAVLRYAEEPFDLVVSGINLGINAGVDVFYSGTVAGALEGALHGITSVALSTDRSNAGAMDAAATAAGRVLRSLLDRDLRPGSLFNVNVPALGAAEPALEFTRQSPEFPAGVLTATNGARGRVHYWLDAEEDGPVPPADTDVGALAAGQISVTPLGTSLTDEDMLASLRTQQTGGLPL